MTKNENFFIRATLTPEQARTVVTALDLFSRIHIGQFHVIGEQILNKNIDRKLLESTLLDARKICFPELSPTFSHSHGIRGCPDERGRIAWDVLQVIRQAEAFGRSPSGGDTVNFDDPLFVSNSVPRPTAKNINILDRLADV